MTLEQFRRTRIEMNQQQYHTLYDIDGDLCDDTAKLHVYAGALYIREYLDGTFGTDMITNCKNNKELDVMEFHFWNEFAQDNLKPTPLVTPEIYDLLMSFKTATANLCEAWLELDLENRTTYKMEQVMGKNIPMTCSFDDFNSDVAEWVEELTNPE